MSYIDKVIEHGTNFKVQRGLRSASFAPVSDCGESFIDLVLVVVNA